MPENQKHSRLKKTKTTPQGRLFILSAPSGAGKTTLCNAIRMRFPELAYSVSYTTRHARKGEKNGYDYHFISEAEFKKNIKQSKWAEWAEVHGHFYGTDADFIDRNLSQGRWVLADIDVAGARQILEKYPDSITIFVMPPSLETLRQRLEKRGTDSKQSITGRLQTARREIAQKGLYRHVIVNDSLPEAVSRLADILKRYQEKNKQSPDPRNTGCETD